MPTKYTDVTLTPPAGGGTLTFHGTGANERVLFSDPHHVGFENVDAKLDLGGGDDVIPFSSMASFHTATADGGAGDDGITLSADGALKAHGGTGDDVLHLATNSDATAFGDAGSDKIILSADSVAKAYGGAGDDVIDAEGGTNEISGGLVYGGAGDDKITVGGGNANAFGGTGNDTLAGGGEFVAGHGGPGGDTLNFSGDDLQLYGDAGNDKLNGAVSSTDEQFLYGGPGNDTIRYTLVENGDTAATVDIYGGAGKDQLYAGAAHDLLHVLAGNTPAGAGRDVVHGFRQGQDHLALDGDADLTRAGTQHYAFVGATKDPGAGEVGYYKAGGDTIVDGFDGRHHFEVQLQGFHGTPDAGDFIA